MQVESFECVETASEPIEATEEALALIESLGLEGQKEFCSERNGHATRSPYRKITQEEFFVYRTLCPQRTKLHEYSDGPIPLRVMQIAAHATQLKIGPYLHVWHRAILAVKDPVLVATDSEYISEWSDRFSDKIWILARWGEELETFHTLIERAAASVHERLKAEAHRMMHAVESLTFSEMAVLGPRLKLKIEE